MLMSQSQIAADPWVATLIVTNIGAATAAVAGAMRIILVRPPRRRIVPLACLFVALAYIALTLEWSVSQDRLVISTGMEVRWLGFELLVMCLVNLVIVEFCGAKETGACHKHGGHHGKYR